MAGTNRTGRKVATNFIVADIAPLIQSTTSFNEGDFLIMDSTNHRVTKPVGETDSANLIGVASCTVVNGKLATAYSTDSDSNQLTPSVPGPTFGDEYYVVLKSGDTAHPGDALYLDPVDNAAGVTVTAGTNKIGVWADAQLTGDGTKTGLAKIGARYPDNKICF